LFANISDRHQEKQPMNELAEQTIYDFFVNSNDYNGIPLTTLAEIIGIPHDKTISIVKQLVIDKKVSIQNDINPHIISLGHYEESVQLKILDEAINNTTTSYSQIGDAEIIFNSHTVCIYPSEEFLRKKRDVSNIKSPYSLRLSLGEPQLRPVYFEIEVLDRYFRDPRFNFKFDEYSGGISYHEDENYVPLVKENDQVFLKTFGLGRDKHEDRVVVVYLRYLSDLTEDHQNYWKSKEIKHECFMLPEYYENTINGNWTKSYSVFSAFISEQDTLNKLANTIFQKNLFIKTFEKQNRPKEFTFFFIPTLKNYHDFILLMDKMLSDNINKDFFTGMIETFEYSEPEVGIRERKEKGTLRLLEEWLSLTITTNRENGVKELIDPLKKIRKERQTPAHKINENIYDKGLIEKQKQIIKECYIVIHTLRQIFQKHPKAIGFEIPNWLDKGQIKIF